MNREELYRIATDAVNDEELSVKEIPIIDLYVDQIINLVAEKLKGGSERYRDRQLTKTMINNYSKDGLITPVKGKKYNKEQIVQILTVYTLKNTLSIGEIKRLLNGIYDSEDFSGEDLAQVYDRHLNIKRENREYALEILNHLIDQNQLDVSDEKEFMLTVSALLSLSAFLRQTAQALIDVQYPQPLEENEEKDEEKEKEGKKEEKKKAKREKKEAKKEAKKEEKESKETAAQTPSEEVR